MEYFILTNTDFFRAIDNTENCECIENAYNGFVAQVIELCRDRMDSADLMLAALSYAEIELQYHPVLHIQETENGLSRYIRKALAFVRKMLKHLTAQVSPLSLSVPSVSGQQLSASAVPDASVRWTGNAIDLVEIIYGINEMGCINNGNMPLHELASALYSFFGVNSKDCYRFYTDIKRRKNDSRTYFLDKMQMRLNEKMRLDDEKERLRR